MPERYQREIEDILGQADELSAGEQTPNRRSFIRGAFSYVGSALSGQGRRISPGKILLTSLALVLVAALFKAVLPGIVAPVLLWAAVIIFILGYALFFINTSDSQEKRWRGRLVEEHPTFWDRLRSWAKGR